MSTSTSTFVMFHKFHSLHEAKELTYLLRDHDIACEFQDLSTRFDASFAYNPTDKQFAVLLRQEDFDRANALLETVSETTIPHLPEDYYLYAFSAHELLEVVIKSDEWNALDIALAKKLLSQQGIDLSAEAIQELREKRLSELAQPDQSPVATIVWGYVIALFGGLLGTAIGLAILFSKKRLPNGQKVRAYAEPARMHGLAIAVLGTLWVFTGLIAGLLGGLLYSF